MAHRISAADWRQCVSRCSGVAGTREDAEDCVQDAFASAFMAAPDSPIEDVGAWITVVARRRAVDVVRRRSTSLGALTRLAHWEVAASDDPADLVANRAEARWLAGRLGELPDATVSVVRLLADGHSLADAAATLGMSYRAAESHLTRARRWARRALAT